MPALVIDPACRVVDELPAQVRRERLQDGPGRFDRPDLVEVAERAAQLQREALAVGRGRVDLIRPVEAAQVEARIARRYLCQGKGPGARQRLRCGIGTRRGWVEGDAAQRLKACGQRG